MASLEELVARTQEVVGALVRKPKMSGKLLARPPFRFLHDTVMALDARGGLVQELFGEDERDSSTITDKDAKVAFLNKLIAFAGICAGAPISVRASKVVAGAEPENTNLLLIALGEAAADESIDYGAAARAALAGEAPGSVPRRGAAGGSAAAAAEGKADGPAGQGDHGAGGDEAKGADDEADAEAEEARRAKEREREKRRQAKEKREKERRAAEAAEAEATASASAEGEAKQAEGEAAAAEAKKGETADAQGSIDMSSVDGEVATTIEMYESLVRKPKMTEKLLSKPPFRYLHDVMSGLNGATGLLEGLFEGEELDSRQCSTKELKLGYLQKLVTFAAVCAGIEPPAKPSRIVAGHEADNTNRLLQVLAILAKNGNMGAMPAAKAVERVTNRETNSAAAAEAVPAGRSQNRETVEVRDRDGEEQGEQRAARRNDRQAAEGKGADDEPSSPAARGEEAKIHDLDRSGTGEDEAASSGGVDGPRSTTPSRPQTARKRPPKIKDTATAVPVKEVHQAGPTAQPVGVMMDGADDSDDESDSGEQPEDGGLRMRGDADGLGMDENSLKGRLVRDILDDEQKSEQQHQQQQQQREEDENESKDDSSRPGTSGITLGKIGQGLRRGGKAGGAGAVDVDKIRTAIQTLCQSTNPLGKCMDYVHEDLGVMAKELERWRADYRKSCDALEDEQRATSETLHPLRGRLLDVEERVKDEQAKLSTLKASIAKNDQRIAELLRDMVLG